VAFDLQSLLKNTTCKEIKGLMKDYVPVLVKRQVYWMPKEHKIMALVVCSGM
jgi:hypothetical protein